MADWTLSSFGGSMTTHIINTEAKTDLFRQKHLERALAFLDQQDLDVLVAASTDSIQSRGNVRYLTNYATSYGTSLAVLDHQRLLLIVPAGSFQLGWARDMAWADETWAVKDYLNSILEGFAEAGIVRGNVGMVGIEDLPGSLDVQLSAALPNFHFKDVSKSFKLMKAVKTEDEILMAKKSVALAESALREIIPALKSSYSVNELFARASNRLSLDGAEDYFILSSSGLKTVSPIPSGKILKRGDVLRCSIEPSSPGGFWTQTIRMFSLGVPAPNIQAAFDLCEESLEAAKKKLVPGYTGGDVAKEIINVLKRAEGGEIGPLGHGMGLDLTEPPFLLLSDNTPIQEGMVIALHPSLTWAEANMWMGDTFLVTETEPELLSTLPNQLVIC
jgi:Xaa-Pro aminopeptidase